MTLSIHLRLLFAASIVLAGFLGLTAVALEQAFTTHSQQAMNERLQGYVYALLAAAEEDKQGGFFLPEVLIDPNFNQPESKLLANVTALDVGYEWSSLSSLGRRLDWQAGLQLKPGVAEYYSLTDGKVSGQPQVYAVIRYSVLWEADSGEQAYLVSVAENVEDMQAGIQSFRGTLWRWLVVVALFLLFAQGVVLRWGLRPLRRVSAELLSIEEGQSCKLAGDYPVELKGLTGSINAFIEQSAKRQSRYRHSLDDLAHSLKTPLAVLQGVVDSGRDGAAVSSVMQEQVDRMNEIVQRQLQRAVASGDVVMVKPVQIKDVVERISRSLLKVYRDREIEIFQAVSSDSLFYGQQADLMELIGNLLDNACKHAQKQVRISVAESPEQLHIQIEDDGAGIPDDLKALVTQRGRRADEALPGQGIGLTVANDLVQAYGGYLQLDDAAQGGTLVNIIFPKNQ